jgi:hypothetical protein
MNSKRRAELQRKLTLNAVPTPPAGLAERIKADIPKYLEAESGPAKFARTMTFPMRIAASLLLVVTSAAVAMLFMSRNREEQVASKATPVIFAPQKRAVAVTDTMTTVAAARTEEVNLDIVEEVPHVPQLAAARIAPSASVEQQDFRDETKVERGVEEDSVEGAVVGGVIGDYGYDAPPPPPVVAEAAAPQAEMPAVAPPAEREFAYDATAPAAPPAAARQQITVTGEAPMAETRRERASAKVAANAFAEQKKDSVFGISVSPENFHEIRKTLESGRRPAASAVNVEALVNYFAGPPEKRLRRVQLEVEASPAAIQADGDHAVLRFTVDTPDAIVPKTSAPSNAHVEVVINSAVVEKARRIGDSEPLGGESVLRPNTSVTGLWALELKPGLRASQLIATVRLHYFDGKKQQTLAETVHGRDLATTWQRASRRHRLASLGALWGESLKSTTGGVDVARRAEELATQAPDDVRARELARAANASAAGGR